MVLKSMYNAIRRGLGVLTLAAVLSGCGGGGKAIPYVPAPTPGLPPGSGTTPTDEPMTEALEFFSRGVARETIPQGMRVGTTGFPVMGTTTYTDNDAANRQIVLTDQVTGARDISYQFDGSGNHVVGGTTFPFSVAGSNDLTFYLQAKGPVSPNTYTIGLPMVPGASHDGTVILSNSSISGQTGADQYGIRIPASMLFTVKGDSLIQAIYAERTTGGVDGIKDRIEAEGSFQGDHILGDRFKVDGVHYDLTN